MVQRFTALPYFPRGCNDTCILIYLKWSVWCGDTIFDLSIGTCITINGSYLKQYWNMVKFLEPLWNNSNIVKNIYIFLERPRTCFLNRNWLESLNIHSTFTIRETSCQKLNDIHSTELLPPPLFPWSSPCLLWSTALIFPTKNEATTYLVDLKEVSKLCKECNMTVHGLWSQIIFKNIHFTNQKDGIDSFLFIIWTYMHRPQCQRTKTMHHHFPGLKAFFFKYSFSWLLTTELKTNSTKNWFQLNFPCTVHLL